MTFHVDDSDIEVLLNNSTEFFITYWIVPKQIYEVT